MVAYHFPPLAGSSGIQRTLRFVQDLPRFGWEALVLSTDTRAYERTSDDLLADVPQGTVVRRAFALDAARHLSILGRHPGFLSRPDRWASWRRFGVAAGLRMIDEFAPQAIWSTYPIATAHAIGAELQRRSGLPWIADFRDPMAQQGYPADPATWAQYRDIESRAVSQAAWSLFTTPSAARMYRQRYPDRADRIELLENGYDESTFLAAEAALGTAPPSPLVPGAFTLLHSGIVYPEERDPAHLFAALRTLQDQGHFAHRPLVVRFRAAVHDAMLHALAAAHGVQARIEVLPPVPYRDALLEMLRADALLVLQAANCNEQVPAKVYEYLRARRPLVCLSDPHGDTAQVLERAGCTLTAPLDDADAIARLLGHVLSSEGSLPLPGEAAVVAASRRGRTERLAGYLDRLLTAEQGHAGSLAALA